MSDTSNGRRSAGIDPAQRMRLRHALPWLYALRLPPWTGALAGGTAGALVGLLIVLNMRRHTVFTEPHQDLIAGAALLALWTLIGVVSGLTVLSPEDDQGDAEP